MVNKLRSKRLTHLFQEVLEHLPKKDRALLSRRILLITDDPQFIPKGQRPIWGAAVGIKFRKSIALIYLSQRKLPRQPDDFVRYVMAHKLAHVFCGHIEKLFEITELDYAGLESEADAQVKKWGFPIPSRKKSRNAS